MTSLLAVVGSVTPPGRLRRAIEGAVERVRTDVVEASLVDLAELRLAFADGRKPAAYEDDTAATIERIAAADGVLFATPVYRGSLTGALKNLIDLIPVDALLRKPVAIVAMGATDHHFLGADRHLRDVLTFFGALVTPVSVYLSSADFVEGIASTAAAAELDLLLANLAGFAAAAPVPDGPSPLAMRRPA